MSERRKVANWMLVMRVETADDIARKILPEDYADVKELLDDIMEYFKSASTKLGKLDLRGGKDISPKTIAARLRWIYGEFDDLKLLVETIEALTTALYAIAEPPPKYGPSWTGSNPPGPAPGRDTQPGFFTPPDPNIGGLFPAEDEPSRTPSAPSDRKPMLNLYERCWRALSFIASQTNGTTYDEATKKVTLRVKTWATEFFDGSYPIDRILTKEKDGERVNEPMRTAIIGTLVDIALIEEQFLSSLSKTCHDRDRRRLEELQLEVVAMLGTEGIVDIAVEHSSPLLDEPESDETNKLAVECITNAVNSLFDILPALRTLRREQVLEEELLDVGREIRSSKAKMPVVLRDVSTGGQRSTTEWLETSINTTSEMENFLLKQEQQARERGESVDVVYSQLVRKERERLEEWSKAVSRKGQITLGEDETEKAKIILQRFTDNLPANISSVPFGDEKGPNTPSSGKAAIADSVIDGKNIQKFLESLNITNEGLWQMRGVSDV